MRRDDLLMAATLANGTDLNGDGAPDYSICWQMHNSCIDTTYVLMQMMAGLTQTQVVGGGGQGALGSLDS